MSDYKDYDTQRSARKSLQRGTRLVYFIHKRLVKPKFPVLLHCASCGRPIFEVNSDTIEIHNTFGMSQESLKASDNWIRHKCHSCSAHISILWK